MSDYTKIILGCFCLFCLFYGVFKVVVEIHPSFKQKMACMLLHNAWDGVSQISL